MTGFTFFQNYFESIDDPDNGLTMEEKGMLYTAIFAYVFNNDLPTDLKGACKLAFYLIKPSLDKSKQNGKNKSKNETGTDSDAIETESNVTEMENEIPFYKNQTKKNGTEMENEISPFLKNKEEEKEDIERTDNACACAREGEKTDETVEGYLRFMKNHPAVREDITSHTELEGVDFDLLAQKISESKRYLQRKNSLRWLVRHYREIIGDCYKDFSARPPDAGKGDLQLWQECLAAVKLSGEEKYVETLDRYAPLYRRLDEVSDEEMKKLYRGLSKEIRSYFDPNSFLELCAMSENDLKFERARFLKALPEIRRKTEATS